MPKFKKLSNTIIVAFVNDRTFYEAMHDLLTILEPLIAVLTFPIRSFFPRNKNLAKILKFYSIVFFLSFLFSL